jgi:hypothetical protein
MLTVYKLSELLLYQEFQRKLIRCQSTPLKQSKQLVPFSSLCHMLQALATLGPPTLDYCQSCREIGYT